MSLTPPVVSPDAGFFDLPLAYAQCCFTAETNVLMADGSERPIAGIRPGDQVIGRAGGVNRVTGMHIVPLGPRALFGINQHHPFFTAEHPFLTPGGWRALDRETTRLETPGLDVAELTAGDVLITAAAVSGETAGALALAPAVSFRHLVLHRLTRAEGDPANRVYNLILEGDHSYVANGFVVHNKGGEGGQGDDGLGDDGQISDDTDVDGAQLAANTTSGEGGTTASSGATGAESTEDTDATSTESGSGEFSGSPAPAGPDLSASEEQDIISGGWK
ncbi:MAG: Hint domain-containing protein [Alphaproteobacteria bacterium]